MLVAEPEGLVPDSERPRPDPLSSHLPGRETLPDERDAWVAPFAERCLRRKVDGHLEELADLDLYGLLLLVDEAEKHPKDGGEPGRHRTSRRIE